MSEVYIRVDEKTSAVTFLHRKPFDPINGLGKTRDELLKTGFFVENFPDPIATPGKRATAYYDHETKKVYYEYITQPFSNKDRLDMIEDVLNYVIGGAGTPNPYTVVSKAPISEITTGITTPETKAVPYSTIATAGASKTVTVPASAYKVTAVKDDEPVEENEEGENMKNGFAKYLAYQIYLKKLDKETVLNTYPNYKEDIEKYLDEWEVIPMDK